MMLVMVAGVEAANPPESRQRMAREQLAETQAKHIAEALAFDEQTAAKFVETYCECQKEIWTLAQKSSDNAVQRKRKRKKRFKIDLIAVRNYWISERNIMMNIANF